MTFIFSGSAFAAHPLITDDTGTQGKKKFQLETNGEYSHDDQDEGVTQKTTEIQATLSYGLNDSLDLVLGIPYQYTKLEDPDAGATEDGVSDTSIELKWRFYEKGSLSFALKPGMTLPTGDDEKGFGTGKVTYSLYFIATHQIRSFLFHLNLGYIRNENTSEILSSSTVTPLCFSIWGIWIRLEGTSASS